MPLGLAARWRRLWNGSGTVSALGHVAQPSTSRLTFASPLTAPAGQDLVSGGVQRGLVLIARERALGHDHDRPFCQSTFSEHLGNSSGTVDVETGDVHRVVSLEQDVNMTRTWPLGARPVELVTPHHQNGLVVSAGAYPSPRLRGVPEPFPGAEERADLRVPALCLPIDSFAAWPSWTDR